MSKPHEPEDRATAPEQQADQQKKPVRSGAEDAVAARVADRDVEEVREIQAEIRAEFQGLRADLFTF